MKLRFMVIVMVLAILAACGPADKNIKDSSTVASLNDLDTLDIPTLQSLAEDELKHKNYAKAHEYNDAALQRETDNLKSKLLKGRIFTDSGAYTDAENYWLALTQEMPGNATVAYYTGQLYERTGKKATALKYYRRSYDLGNTSAHLVNILSDTYMRERKYQDAINFFQYYLTKNAADTMIRFNLGQCYLFIGQTSNAIVQFEYLTVKFPAFSLGHYGMGFAYHGIAMRTTLAKDKSRAIAFFEKFLSMEKSRTFYINKAKQMIAELKK